MPVNSLRPLDAPGLSVPPPEDSAARWRTVRAAIARAARDAGRAALARVTVSNTCPAEAVAPVLEAGERVFGENYVQEARAKWPPLKERFGAVELHLVGPLQSNKARDAVALFDAIHSLDRPSLAEALAKEVVRQNRQPQLFVEINTGSEPQKAGVLPEDADAFVARCRDIHGLAIAGLMCIPPFDEAPAPHFALT